MATAKEVWERFSAWVHAVCVVTFDLELGQAMEIIYPPQAKLTEEEKTSVCYLAFPDSNSGCMGDTKFHFRFRHGPGHVLNRSQVRFNRNSPVSLQAAPDYLHGFVYFRQVKDSNLPRGYFQKSFIVLSRLPFVNLFIEVCGMIAPEFFRNGVQSVEAACHDIDQWPEPEPGETLSLPLLGTVIQAIVPSDSSQWNIAVPANSLPLVHLPSLFSRLSSCVHHIHLLWELVLTAEPIVVMASSPDACSHMVHCLVSMISPLKYCAEYRPYFTIHDSEFKEYTKMAPPPVILGVTNPFFSKTLQHWPHIVKLAETPSLQRHKVKRGVSKGLEGKAGVYTRYEAFLRKDKAIGKKLAKGVQTGRPEEAQSALVRRHLVELTQSFVIPLERYMSTLMPLHKDVSAWRAAPRPLPFDREAFLATLERSGPQLTTGIKGDWGGLYRKFLSCPNFDGWYRQRHKAMTEKLETLQLEALSEADLNRWVEGKEEVEVVDMLLRMRCKMADCAARELPLSEETLGKLQQRTAEIVATLPEDLRSVLTQPNS